MYTWINKLLLLLLLLLLLRNNENKVVALLRSSHTNYLCNGISESLASNPKMNYVPYTVRVVLLNPVVLLVPVALLVPVILLDVVTENWTFPSPCQTRALLETEKENEVKRVVWLRRIAHFQAIVGQGPSYLCGQNFESHRSEVPLIIWKISHRRRTSQKFYLKLETEKGNEIKTMMWLRRIAHFQAIVGQGPSDPCGQNFERHRSEVPLII